MSNIGGLVNGIWNAIVSRNIRVLAGVLFPVLRSLTQVLACEVFPNAARARLRHKIERLYVLHGNQEAKWEGLSKCAELTCTTFRFWMLGTYTIKHVLFCKMLSDIIFKDAPEKAGKMIAGLVK